MVRKLHKVLGYYIPAFFEMHVDTEADDLTINKLDAYEMTVLFHEYIHFLQDISTYYGLSRIYVYSEYLRSVVNRIYRGDSYNVSVPVVISDNNDNVLLNQQIQKLTDGDGRINELSSFAISNIDIYFDTLLVNPELESIPSVIISTVDGDVLTFGSIAITESMAYLMERSCSPSAYKQSPEYPYMAAEKVADFFVPKFSDDNLMILALCDMAQMSSNPGVFFVDVMKDIRDGKLSFDSPEKVYDYFYNQTYVTVNNQQCNMLNKFQELLVVVKKQLKGYLDGVSNITSFYDWIDRLFDFAIGWRNKDPYFILKMARHNDIRTNNFFGYCIYNIGSPMMSNNKGFYFLIPPNGMDINIGVEMFKAIYQIEQLFSCGTKSCMLYEWCKKSPESNPSELCQTAPWKKINDKRLCPYAFLWKHWNLSNYEII